MWVERIEIEGFGRLRNLSIELRDGLNVVTGLNEAGKSTLHQAIATALFGCFSTTDRRKEQDAERRRERFAPWDGGPYRVSIVTRSAQGAALRIDWDLSGRTSFVARDAITGQDRTTATRGVGDGVLRADLHGISRAVFERSLVVRQGELAAIADEEGAVAAALESALASSERNASASRAVELLAAQRDAIGTARSSKRPLPLARAEAHHAAEALRDAEEAREQIEGAALAAREAAITAEAAERRLVSSRATASSRRLAEIEQWVTRVTALEGSLGELERKRAALADAAPIEASAIVELENARDARATASGRAERARRAADAVEPALAEAEGRLREIDTLVAMHEAYRDGPDGPALRELETVLDRLRARPASAPVTTRRPAVALGPTATLIVAAVLASATAGLVPAAALVVLALVTGAMGVHWLMLERDRRRQAQHVNDEDEERRGQLLAAAGIDPARRRRRRAIPARGDQPRRLRGGERAGDGPARRGAAARARAHREPAARRRAGRGRAPRARRVPADGRRALGRARSRRRHRDPPPARGAAAVARRRSREARRRARRTARRSRSARAAHGGARAARVRGAARDRGERTGRRPGHRRCARATRGCAPPRSQPSSTRSRPASPTRRCWPSSSRRRRIWPPGSSARTRCCRSRPMPWPRRRPRPTATSHRT